MMPLYSVHWGEKGREERLLIDLSLPNGMVRVSHLVTMENQVSGGQFVVPRESFEQLFEAMFADYQADKEKG